MKWNFGISRSWNLENPELENIEISELWNSTLYDPGIIVFQTYRNLEESNIFEIFEFWKT